MRPSLHIRPSPNVLRRWSIAALCLGLAWTAPGCAQDLTLHVRIGNPPGIPGLTNGPLSAAGVTAAGAIALDRVALVLREIRLESTPTVGDEASPGRNVLLSGPHLVELSDSQLFANAITRIASGIHTGPNSFYELDADLAAVTPGDALIVPDLAPLVGESLVISGRYRGEPFTFRSSLKAVLKGESVFRLGTNHNHIDLGFAPNLWFVDPVGAVLDPADPANRETIEQNIVRSFSSYEDDDLDGAPDSLG